MVNPVALRGKTALVTGAAHRIGATIARTLHAEGMNVAIHYRRSRDDAERLATELGRQRPETVMLVQRDLCVTSELQALIDEVAGNFGGLDVLVNNASSFFPTPVGETTEAQWDELLGSNAKAPFFLAQAASATLRRNCGCIVHLLDIHAERPLKRHPVYSAAKAANAMLVKALARELGPEVRVNGIAPGAILWPEQKISEAAKKSILERTALARTGAPGDIARAVLFLIRDADYITGQILTVDGGRTVQQ